jgi:hypothetical protein
MDWEFFCLFYFVFFILQIGNSTGQVYYDKIFFLPFLFKYSPVINLQFAER